MTCHISPESIMRQTGFTLVEITIVLFIVALLLGGLLPTISGQIEQRRTSETIEQLEEIKEALIGYAIINGRLPCPADGTTPTGGANAALVPAGQEYKNPTVGSPYICANVVGNNVVGVLPWATLGVNETDAWGRRYSYQVTATWADSTDGTIAPDCNITVGVSFQLCSSPNQNILATVGGTSLTPNNVPAVVVSHGRNGAGAYTQQGVQLPVSSDADEQENSNGTVSFVSKSPTPTFDDLMVWISPNTLINRMVAAGRLP